MKSNLPDSLLRQKAVKLTLLVLGHLCLGFFLPTATAVDLNGDHKINGNLGVTGNSDFGTVSQGARNEETFYPNVASIAMDSRVEGMWLIRTPLLRSSDRIFKIRVQGYIYSVEGAGPPKIVDYTISGYTPTSGALLGAQIIDIGSDGRNKYIGLDPVNHNVVLGFADTGASFWGCRLAVDAWITKMPAENAPNYTQGWSFAVEKSFPVYLGSPLRSTQVLSGNKLNIGVSGSLSNYRDTFHVGTGFAFSDGTQKILGMGYSIGDGSSKDQVDLDSQGHAAQIRLSPADGWLKLAVSYGKDNNLDFNSKGGLVVNSEGCGGIGITPTLVREQFHIGTTNGFSFHTGGQRVIAIGWSPATGKDRDSSEYAGEIRYNPVQGAWSFGIAADKTTVPTYSTLSITSKQGTGTGRDLVGVGTGASPCDLHVTGDARVSGKLRVRPGGNISMGSFVSDGGKGPP